MKAQPLKVAMVKTEPALTSPTSQPLVSSSDSALPNWRMVSISPSANLMRKVITRRADFAPRDTWARLVRDSWWRTDLGDPITASATGLLSSRAIVTWVGNVVIVRHTYRENGDIKYIDALYGHLNSMSVRRASRSRAANRSRPWARRMVSTMRICIWRFARTWRSYEPRQVFARLQQLLRTLAIHRFASALAHEPRKFRVAMNTFTYDSQTNWASKKNIRAYRGGSAESAAALKRAVAAQGGSH